MKAISTRAPRPEIHVTDEDIDTAMPANSRHCMIALAIQRHVPSATHILIDIQTIRWSDKNRRLRFTYFTPAKVIAILIGWDDGQKPKPFSFNLRSAHVTATWIGSKRTGGKKLAHKLGKKKRIKNRADEKAQIRPTVVGGKPPPVSRFSRDQRVFGSRRLANLLESRSAVDVLKAFAQRES